MALRVFGRRELRGAQCGPRQGRAKRAPRSLNKCERRLRESPGKPEVAPRGCKRVRATTPRWFTWPQNGPKEGVHC
eukprot:3617574-Pyramimonas_sp.AAC.1